MGDQRQQPKPLLARQRLFQGAGGRDRRAQGGRPRDARDGTGQLEPNKTLLKEKAEELCSPTQRRDLSTASAN